MNRIDLQRQVANKISAIRRQYYTEKGKRFTQADFVSLYNKTEPTDIKLEVITFGSYERGDRNCPSDKYEKILSLDKGE